MPTGRIGRVPRRISQWPEELLLKRLRYVRNDGESPGCGFKFPNVQIVSEVELKHTRHQSIVLNTEWSRLILVQLEIFLSWSSWSTTPTSLMQTIDLSLEKREKSPAVRTIFFHLTSQEKHFIGVFKLCFL